MKLSKSTTKTLEMLCEAFGEHSLSQVECSVEDDECSGRSSISKVTENVEKI
jgi:hypothetical protein